VNNVGYTQTSNDVPYGVTSGFICITPNQRRVYQILSYQKREHTESPFDSHI